MSAREIMGKKRVREDRETETETETEEERERERERKRERSLKRVFNVIFMTSRDKPGLSHKACNCHCHVGL